MTFEERMAAMEQTSREMAEERRRWIAKMERQDAEDRRRREAVIVAIEAYIKGPDADK